MSLWNRIDQYGKRNGLRYLEKLFSRPLVRPSDIDWTKVRRLLIVRPHDQLGDFLLSSPAWKALGRALPRVHIGMVARSYAADVVYHHPHIDELLVFYENGLRWNPVRICRFARKLYKKWDMALVLSSESHSLTSDLLAMLSGARYVGGSARKKFPGCSRNFFYNLIAPDNEGRRHQSRRNCDIIEYLGIEVNDYREYIHIDEDEKERMRSSHPHLYQNGRKTIGLHIGANKRENRWPVEKFAELTRLLSRNTEIDLAVFWGPREHSLAKEYGNLVRDEGITLVPPSSLRSLAVHFSLCHGAVCNDTGIMHLCAAVGTPLVAVFGPTDPQYWKPPGESFLAVRASDHCTAGVAVSQVLAELDTII